MAEEVEAGSKREREEEASDEEVKRQAVEPPEPETDPDLPPDWVQHTSRRTGKPYWYNNVTKQTTWVHPAKQNDQPESPPSSPPGDGGSHPPADPPGVRIQCHPLTKLPMRPDGIPCKHFVQHGNCRFGEKCKFDHPASHAADALLMQYPVRTPGTPVPSNCALVGGLPVRDGVGNCDFFIKTGMCKFGEMCKYNHPAVRQCKLACMVVLGQKGGAPTGSIPNLGHTTASQMARPQMATTPAFAAGQPAAVPMMQMHPMPVPNPAPPPQPPQPPVDHGWEVHMSDMGRPYYYNNQTGVSTWDMPMELMNPAPAPQPQPQPQMMVPQYQPQSQYGMPGMGTPGAMAMAMPGAQPVFAAGAVQEDLPQRPGVQDCSFYLKTGSCKFADKFKYNHPPGIAPTHPGGPSLIPGQETRVPTHVKIPASSTTSSGAPLPVRPGAENCKFYMKTGTCSYGDTCKYNHPPGVNAA